MTETDANKMVKSIYEEFGIKLDIRVNTNTNKFILRYTHDPLTRQMFEMEMGMQLIISSTPQEIHTLVRNWLMNQCGAMPTKEMEQEKVTKRKRVRMGKWRVRKQLL